MREGCAVNDDGMRRVADRGTDEWRRAFQTIPHSSVYQGQGDQQQVANVPTTIGVIVIDVDAIDVKVAVVVIVVVVVDTAMPYAVCCVYVAVPRVESQSVARLGEGQRQYGNIANTTERCTTSAKTQPPI